MSKLPKYQQPIMQPERVNRPSEAVRAAENASVVDMAGELMLRGKRIVGASPGGSAGQMQYNEAGALAGSSAIVTNSAGQLALFNGTPIDKPAALTEAVPTITHTTPDTDDYAISAPVSTLRPYGFANANEFNTVMKVIRNLQTRVNELETKLKSLGVLS